MANRERVNDRLDSLKAVDVGVFLKGGGRRRGEGGERALAVCRGMPEQVLSCS